MSGGAGIIDLTASQTGRAPNGRFFQFDIRLDIPYYGVINERNPMDNIFEEMDTIVSDFFTVIDNITEGE
jgi:hypothetical protein